MTTPWWKPKKFIWNDIPMPTAAHLEQLRMGLISIFVFLFTFSIISYVYIDKILLELIKPVGKLVFTHPAEAFFARIKLAFYIGLILSIPVIFYQIWNFIAPALKAQERKHAAWFLPIASLLFFAGIIFAYLFVLPVGMNFLLSYQSDNLQALISLNSYVSFVGMLLVSFGLVAEMPLIIVLLAALGIVDDKILRKKRGTAIVIIFLVAGILTPGPDIFSQLLMAVPMLILFEISIIISRFVQPKLSEPDVASGGYLGNNPP